MAGNVAKSAFTIFAVGIISAGNAFAQDENLIDKIYAEMESGKKQTFEVVSTSADHRIASTMENKRKKAKTDITNEPTSPSS